jgi:twitching motility protein PilT
MPSAVPFPASLEDVVAVAFQNGYSDVHLGVGEEPRFRDRGEILRAGWPVTDMVTFHEWLREMLTPAQIDTFLRDKEYDGSHAFPFARVRINLLETLRGPGMVLRLIPQRIPSIDDLELPQVLKTLLERPKGLMLITGPTGSGKTTTQAAMIDHINRTMKRHIVSIEDPIEYVHESRECLIRQREVGQNTRLFKVALRASLREDPDVILIGEVRDHETLSTAIEASQTGQLVLGTLHTSSAVRSVERVLSMCPPQEQESIRRSLAEALLAVVSQGLIRTREGGRTAYHDILINTDACRDYIQRAELDEIEAIMSRSSFDGMHTINQSLEDLVRAGRISDEDALAVSAKPSELIQRLRGRT